MMSSQIKIYRPLPAVRCQLGEGPLWHVPSQSLWFVDIVRGDLHRFTPSSGRHAVVEVAPDLSAVAPLADGGFLAAAGHDLLQLTDSGEVSRSWTVESGLVDNRFNDCRVDPAGRWWAGTMSKVRERGQAALYRLAHGALDPVITGTTLSNGIAWSPDGRLMYFVDSTTQRIDVMTFDVTTGSLGERRSFAAIDAQHGLPDGLTVDSAGGVWVCLFRGGAVRRYAPDGTLDLEIDLPVQHPTCPTFGGEDLETLYVTTSQHLLDDDQRAASPWAGSVLAVETGFTGLPSTLAALD